MILVLDWRYLPASRQSSTAAALPITCPANSPTGQLSIAAGISSDHPVPGPVSDKPQTVTATTSGDSTPRRAFRTPLLQLAYRLETSQWHCSLTDYTIISLS